jgi:hypothetical protein
MRSSVTLLTSDKPLKVAAIAESFSVFDPEHGH